MGRATGCRKDCPTLQRTNQKQSQQALVPSLFFVLGSEADTLGRLKNIRRVQLKGLHLDPSQLCEPPWPESLLGRQPTALKHLPPVTPTLLYRPASFAVKEEIAAQ